MLHNEAQLTKHQVDSAIAVPIVQTSLHTQYLAGGISSQKKANTQSSPLLVHHALRLFL